jgi:MscS family membrane protein
LEALSSFWSRPAGPWTVGVLVLAFLLLVGGFIARRLIVSWVGRRLEDLAANTETEADDIAVRAVVGPLGTLVLLVGLYLAFRLLAAGFFENLDFSSRLFRVATTLIVAWALFRLVDAGALVFAQLARRTDTTFDDQLVPVLRKSAKVLVGLLAFLLSAQNLGYSVSGLLAGLGLGGFAFALAAKDTIANLFGGVAILIDRPFRVGDWITFDGTDGVVEEIGLRSSRIRTFAKTLVSVPNQTLSNATVENHSLMPKRRVKMSVGVTYDATPGQMRELVAGVEALLKRHPGVDQEFMLVKFTEFGESSLDLFVYYFSGTTDWTEHLQVRQEINLAIMDQVEALGLSVAFPTRTVHLVQENGA